MRSTFESSVMRILLAFLAMACVQFPLRAEPPETLPAGMGKYVMMLWEPGTPKPGSDGKELLLKVEEPDVEKRGGRVLHRKNNQRLIVLPMKAAAELRRHRSVMYLQRLWMGEDLDGWDERTPSDDRMAAQTDTEVAQATPWGPRSFDYDDSGNITAVGPDQYAYDSAGRLVSATVNGTTQTYKYDAFGNLIEMKTGSAAASIAIDSASNRLVQATYDAAGNVVNDRGRTYKWDSVGSLVKARDGRWNIYDADDELVGGGNLGPEGFPTRTTWTIRDFEGRVLREYTGEYSEDSDQEYWIWRLDRFYGAGQAIASDSQLWSWNGGAIQYGGLRHYHVDHLGTVRMVTDGDGRSIAENDHYPFGVAQTKSYQEQLKEGDVHVDNLRFAGHTREFLDLLNAESQNYLDYMHARWYEPHEGRFLSVDPARASARQTAPQTWNRYTYARNNPILRIDPDGLVDRRSPDDKEITESTAALRVAALLNMQRKVESGATIVVKRTASGRRYAAAGPWSDNRADEVKVLLPPAGAKDVTAVATMHNHVAHGVYQVPSRTEEGKTESWSPSNPTQPSGADAAAANQAGVTGYITVPSEGVLVKVNPDCTSEVILSESDYDAWAMRAREYVNAPVEQTPP